jgi:hypothetical protein
MATVNRISVKTNCSQGAGVNGVCHYSMYLPPLVGCACFAGQKLALHESDNFSLSRLGGGPGFSVRLSLALPISNFMQGSPPPDDNPGYLEGCDVHHAPNYLGMCTRGATVDHLEIAATTLVTRDWSIAGGYELGKGPGPRGFHYQPTIQNLENLENLKNLKNLDAPCAMCCDDTVARSTYLPYYQ